MAYSKKTWVDRVVEFAGRRLLTATGTADTYDVTRAEGTILNAGDAFDAATLNDLEDRVEAGLGEKANLSGAVFTGTVQSISFHQTPENYGWTNELGAYIDMHAVGSVADYDVRLAIINGFLELGNPNIATTGKSQYGRILTRPAIIENNATITLDLSHAEGRIVCLNELATDIVIKVPKNSATAFPIGTSIDIVRAGAGEVTFAPVDGDVTVSSLASYKSILAQYAAASLIKTNTDEWVLIGALKA